MIREPPPQYFHLSFAADQDRHRHGERDAGQLVDVRVWSRWSRAPEKRVTGRTGQVECGRQRAYGFDMRPPPFAALQRAHGMDRQPRNRRELLLREARRVAECLQLRPE